MQHITQEHKALATTLFERFFASNSFEDTLNYFSQIVEVLGLKQGRIWQFYPILRQCILNNNAQNLFRILDERRKNPVYQEGKAGITLTTLVVGCGPCGLRTAIEAQLMGSRVVMLEKRKSATRNNVLHIWPFVIEDLKLLGVKVFFPKFCTGSMNHISIRRLQSVLVKVALILGVEVHLSVAFSGLIEPRNADEGWRIKTTPACPPVNNLEIDVLVGAEGKHVTVPGFPRKEFRGKLAIAITANFVNNHTTAEAVVEEISGVAFVYKQDFFNALYDELGIALENIVYYKDETHYFVMTTKKHSLLGRGVLKEDYKDPVELLKQSNINQEALLDYIRDTCDYCTDYQLPNLEFALNHHGKPDVAMFDFTSMFAARNSIYVKERHSKQLMLTLVGDGLIEPFWPTGTGCARGFLGAFDACWAMRNWARSEMSVLQIIAEREAIYKILPQTTPENIAKEARKYTIDPTSRYTHVNYRSMSAEKVLSLYDSDRMDNGWKRPIIDNRKLTAILQEAAAISAGHLPRSKTATDLEFLQRKKAEIKRQLSNVDLQKQQQQQRMSISSDPRAGLALMERNSCVSANKPSIHGKKKGIKVDNSVNRLTSEQMAVLQAQPEESPRSNGAAAVGKLSQDQLDVLLQGDGASSESNNRKASAPGKLSHDQLAVLMGEDSSPNRHSASPGKLGQDQLAVLMGNESSSPNRYTSSPGKLSQDQLSVLMGSSNNRPNNNASKSLDRPGHKSRQDMPHRSDDHVSNARRLAKQRQQQQMQQQSKPKKLSMPGDLNIDMELDDMLVQLDNDQEFQSLSDNEKMAWLESLFFLDTGPSAPASSLNKTKPKDKDHTLSINKAPGSTAPRVQAPAQQQRPKSPPKIKVEPPKLKPSEEKSPTRVSGVNPRMVSVAQSFFSNDPQRKKSAPAKVNQPSPNPFTRSASSTSLSSNPGELMHSFFGNSPQNVSPSPSTRSLSRSPTQPSVSPSRTASSTDKKPSAAELAQSFFGTSSTPSTAPSALAKSATTSGMDLVPERAFFEPASPSESKRSPIKDDDVDVPPVPPRSTNTKAAMLRLMANATNIMKQ